MPNVELPESIVTFIAKWALATNQREEVCTKRFWDLITNTDISVEMTKSMLADWMKEAGYDES